MHNDHAWRTRPFEADFINPMSSAPKRASAASSASARVRIVLLLAGALGWLATSLGASHVQASNPGEFMSELITPAGWELHTSSGRCSWTGDLSSSIEIITPEGWADTSREEPRWGGGVCSELVVPADWNSGHYASTH